MVRALLAGSKTQTRRAVKLPEYVDEPIRAGFYHPTVTDRHGQEYPGDEVYGAYTSDGEWARPCPYGQPGDRLWVRETWQEDPEDDGTWAYTQYMGCKGSPLSDIPRKFQKPEYCIYREGWTGSALVWRPSIHMPRWASRILLEITGVRVERLQDIGTEDIEAEGVTTSDEAIMEHGCRARVIDFTKLWEGINGAGSWDANPWVWVVEFKLVQPC
jgi:hypothetical protein